MSHIMGETVNGVLGSHEKAVVGRDIGSVIIAPWFKGRMFGDVLLEVGSGGMGR
jgi:hypothetical protein